MSNSKCSYHCFVGVILLLSWISKIRISKERFSIQIKWSYKTGRGEVRVLPKTRASLPPYACEPLTNQGGWAQGGQGGQSGLSLRPLRLFSPWAGGASHDSRRPSPMPYYALLCSTMPYFLTILERRQYAGETLTSSRMETLRRVHAYSQHFRAQCDYVAQVGQMYNGWRQWSN